MGGFTQGWRGFTQGWGGSRRGGGVLTYRLAPWGVVPGLSQLCHMGSQLSYTYFPYLQVVNQNSKTRTQYK